MELIFNIYVCSKSISIDKTVCSFLIIGKSDDQVKERSWTGILDKTKNQSEVITCIYALQSIKPEFRSGSVVNISIIQGYAMRMAEKFLDGTWKNNPIVNKNLIGSFRDMLNKYSNITINKAVMNAEFLRCLSMSKALL